MADIEQIEKMARAMCGFCVVEKRCALNCCAPCSDVASQDCSYKENAEMLISAGYGEVSEYKAEIERLKDKCEELRNEKWNAQDDLDCYCDEMPTKIKRAKIDVLNKLKKRARTSYVLDDFILGNVVFSKDIDEIIEEVQNGEDKS